MFFCILAVGEWAYFLVHVSFRVCKEKKKENRLGSCFVCSYPSLNVMKFSSLEPRTVFGACGIVANISARLSPLIKSHIATYTTYNQAVPLLSEFIEGWYFRTIDSASLRQEGLRQPRAIQRCSSHKMFPQTLNVAETIERLVWRVVSCCFHENTWGARELAPLTMPFSTTV
ncbi:hypothetical protein VTO42DRAFT_6368 [Malbranchea cinnamomea]